MSLRWRSSWMTGAYRQVEKLGLIVERVQLDGLPHDEDENHRHVFLLSLELGLDGRHEGQQRLRLRAGLEHLGLVLFEQGLLVAREVSHVSH